MDEFEFINHIKPSSYRQPSLQKGIGDDAAVFRANNEEIVTAVDTFVENIHFSDKTMPPFYIGYRALAANISDMAAMGATPTFYLVSIVIPNTRNNSFIQEIYKGMEYLADSYGIDLIGGDTVSGNELCLSITIMGTIPINKSRYRSLAMDGDIIFVTGNLGDSRAGLEILLHDLDVRNKDYFIKRHQMPQPRVQFAKSLNSLSRVALNDITDGIANELNEIAKASKVDITIVDKHIPIHEGLKQFSSSEQDDWKYFGGEDFELVGAAAAADWNTIKHHAVQQNLKVTKIGVVHRMKGNAPYVYAQKDGRNITLLQNGYTHLK